MKGPTIINLFKDISLRPHKSSKMGESSLGMNLFGKVLAKEIRTANSSKGYQVPDKDASKRATEGEKIMASLGGFAGINLALPLAQRNILANILKTLGLNKEQITLALSRATDSDGLIHLNRLWRCVRGLLFNKPSKGSSFAINKSYMPQLALVLLRLGIDPEKMKKTLEKHVVSKTDSSLKDVTAILRDLVPGLKLGSEDTQALLRQLNIPLEPQDLRSLVKEFTTEKKLSTALKNPDASQRVLVIRRVIAQALREKGLAPEKVKQIVEGINIKSVRSFVEQASQKVVTDKEIESILEGLRIKGKFRNSLGSVKEHLKAELIRLNQEKGKNLQPHIPERGAATTSDSDKVANLLNATRLLGPKSGKGDDLTHFKETIMEKIQAIFSVDEPNRKVEEILRPDPMTRWIDPHQTIQKIMQHLKWMVMGAKQESTMILHPPELGQMDLRVLVKQGHLQVQLGTEHPWAKEIVEGNLNILRQQLNQAGFVVDKLDVMVGLGGGGFEAHSGHGEHRGRFSSLKGQTSNQIFGIQEVSTPAVVLSKEHNLSIVV